MPVNFEKLNGTTNGKAPELKRPAHPAQEPQEQPKHFQQQDLGQDKPAPHPVEAMHQQVGSAIDGLKQAELSYAAQAFQRLSQQFEVDTDRISQTAEFLLDPRVKVATGILKAADRINTRKEQGLSLPFGGYSFQMPQIPGVPDFGQFYSHSGQSAQALPSSTSSSETEN